MFCTNAVGEDATLGDQVRQAKKVFWQYSGTTAASPADRARFTFGFYFHSFNSRGSLCWAYNWFTDRFDNSQGDNWGYGWYSSTDVIRRHTTRACERPGMTGDTSRRSANSAREKGVEVEKFLDEIGQVCADQSRQGRRGYGERFLGPGQAGWE